MEKECIENACGTVNARISLLCNTGKIENIEVNELHEQRDQCFENNLEKQIEVLYARNRQCCQCSLLRCSILMCFKHQQCVSFLLYLFEKSAYNNNTQLSVTLN